LNSFFRKILNKNLSNTDLESFNVRLFYTIEYHYKHDYNNSKPRNKDELKNYQNSFRPHLHGYLCLSKELNISEFELIQKQLKDNYGRCQFFLEKDYDKVQNWRGYCIKYVEWNDQLKEGLKHLHEEDIVLMTVKNKEVKDPNAETVQQEKKKRDCKKKETVEEEVKQKKDNKKDKIELIETTQINKNNILKFIIS
jgi:hypothetical protein